jgi:archaeosine synthase beta-subunit
MLDLSRKAIELRRGDRASVEPKRPTAFLLEQEPATKPFPHSRQPISNGRLPAAASQATVATLFLTGAECAYRCTMCDLWKYTLVGPTQPIDLLDQIDWSFREIEKQNVAPKPIAEWIKLYNASNFFDPRSVPEEDLPSIAERCAPYARVVVENHPKLVRPAIRNFANQLTGRLEIAMGLETINARSMELLRKGFDLNEYAYACDSLAAMDIDQRAFVMLQPPGTSADEAVDWAIKTLTFANDLGARHCSIIPTRMGNGTMEKFRELGLFEPPSLQQLEEVLHIALDLFDRMLVTVDLWGLEHLSGSCVQCFASRRSRLEQMNLSQQASSAISLTCNCSSSAS